jgi:hypothetical protein
MKPCQVGVGGRGILALIGSLLQLHADATQTLRRHQHSI